MIVGGVIDGMMLMLIMLFGLLVGGGVSLFLF